MAHKTPVRRKGGRAGLPQVSGCHVVRGRQSSPVLEVRPGNTVNIQVKLGGNSPGQDRRLPDMVALQTLADDQHSIWGGDRLRKRLRSLSTGSRVGRNPPHRYGSMNSQACVGAGNWLDHSCVLDRCAGPGCLGTVGDSCCGAAARVLPGVSRASLGMYPLVDWLVCRVFKRRVMNTQHWSREGKFRVTEALVNVWWSCDDRCGDGYHVNSTLT